MNTTSASLLLRLREPAADQAWERFVELYTPLVYYWVRRAGLKAQDAADLVQDVFAALVEKMPAFEYDDTRSFRSWLRTVTLNKLREKLRRRTVPTRGSEDGSLSDLAEPDPIDDLSESEYRQRLATRAMELMQSEFQPTTWKACWEHVVSGRSAAEVAAELGISEGAVYVAKCRVLKRLREELTGLWT